MRPWQQPTALVDGAVGIGRGDAFDPDRVAATGCEQSRHLDEVFLALTGHDTHDGAASGVDDHDLQMEDAR